LPPLTSVLIVTLKLKAFSQMLFLVAYDPKLFSYEEKHLNLNLDQKLQHDECFLKKEPGKNFIDYKIFEAQVYSVSVPPCHLLSKYRIRLNKPLLRIISISTENSSHVLVVVVFIISAPMKNSKLSVKYPER